VLLGRDHRREVPAADPLQVLRREAQRPDDGVERRVHPFDDLAVSSLEPGGLAADLQPPFGGGPRQAAGLCHQRPQRGGDRLHAPREPVLRRRGPDLPGEVPLGDPVEGVRLPLQRLGRRTERLRDLADLVLRAPADLDRQLAASELPQGAQRLLERARDGAGEQDGVEDRQRHAEADQQEEAGQQFRLQSLDVLRLARCRPRPQVAELIQDIARGLEALGADSAGGDDRVLAAVRTPRTGGLHDLGGGPLPFHQGRVEPRVQRRFVGCARDLLVLPPALADLAKVLRVAREERLGFGGAGPQKQQRALGDEGLLHVAVGLEHEIERREVLLLHPFEGLPDREGCDDRPGREQSRDQKEAAAQEEQPPADGNVRETPTEVCHPRVPPWVRAGTTTQRRSRARWCRAPGGHSAATLRRCGVRPRQRPVPA